MTFGQVQKVLGGIGLREEGQHPLWEAWHRWADLAERTKYSSRSQGACREAGSGQSEEGVQGSLKTKGKADRWKHKTICIRGQGKEHVLLM